MGRAREVVAGFVTNAGATFTNLTVSPGDGLTVRNTEGDSAAYLDMVGIDAASDAEVRIFSPRLHDQINGVRLGSNASSPEAATGWRFRQRLWAQDPLTVQATSGGADSSAVCLGIDYENIGGLSARLATWEEIAGRIEDYYGVRNDFATSATIGTWLGEAINADQDQFEVNRDYAVIGADVDPLLCAVTYRGADTGNVRNGFPGSNLKFETREWFLRKGLETQLPQIPVFNSANRGNVLVEAVDNAASTAADVNTILALLRA